MFPTADPNGNLKQAAHGVVGVRLRLVRHTAHSARVQPSLYLYWIDGVLDIAASASSKVLISLTPRRRQLAR